MRGVLGSLRLEERAGESSSDSPWLLRFVYLWPFFFFFFFYKSKNSQYVFSPLSTQLLSHYSTLVLLQRCPIFRLSLTPVSLSSSIIHFITPPLHASHLNLKNQTIYSLTKTHLDATSNCVYAINTHTVRCGRIVQPATLPFPRQVTRQVTPISPEPLFLFRIPLYILPYPPV